MPSVNKPLPFEAYTGNDPYVFVSYAHKDGATVYPEILALHEASFRIWYDEGIDPGNEWSEEIAKALAGASWFLVFISAAAIQSRNVKNEINFALNKNKGFLAVYLEDIELPPGLELRMGDIQAVMKWRMSAEQYMRKMAKALPANLRRPNARSHRPMAVPSVVEGSVEDRLARAVHENERQSQIAQSARQPTYVSPVWQNLDDEMKSEAIGRAHHIVSSLRTLGYDVESDDSHVAWKPTMAEVERLAEFDHEHWCEERRARGWSLGPKRDAERMITPYLVPWKELEDTVREYSRDEARRLPELLMRASLAPMRNRTVINRRTSKSTGRAPARQLLAPSSRKMTKR